MGEEAVLLRNVGLGSVADVLDEFYRQVLELNNEMSGKVRFFFILERESRDFEIF